MDKNRELGKLQRYTDLMQGDVKNALHTVKPLVEKDGEDSNIGSVQWHLEEISKHLKDIRENLKQCTTTEN